MTQDQEKELQKAAEEYYAKEHDREDGELVKPYTLKSFLAGAKHQDAISRRDERRLIIEKINNWLGVHDNSHRADSLRTLLKEIETGELK